MLVLLC